MLGRMVIKRRVTTATKFYKEIFEERHNYKLINDLFIVKYVKGNMSVLIAEFSKKGSVLNDRKQNLVYVLEIPEYKRQRFKISKSMVTTSLGFWKKTKLKLQEKPIEEILT